jgi:hypothetical protein
VAKHLEIDDGETEVVHAPAGKPTGNPDAPYGYKNDGVTPRGRPGRRPEVVNTRPPQAQTAQATAPLRRNNPRPVPREQPREMSREPSRSNATVLGRNGEELTRMRPEAGGDLYEKVKCPDPDYTYQWNSVSALGKEMDEQELQMFANGWRPVPASRHPGIYSAPGYEGQIVVKGLRLEERPKTLTAEAMYEDQMRAQQQTRDQTDALRLTQAKLPGADHGARGNKISLKIDRSFTADIPRPQHMMDDE